jgi:hypothetical protein
MHIAMCPLSMPHPIHPIQQTLGYKYMTCYAGVFDHLTLGCKLSSYPEKLLACLVRHDDDGGPLYAQFVLPAAIARLLQP